ncbi:MAG: DUF3108 domain-containing protein [Bacteroidales bacterium]|nr:DUF3108 domain-containing protein [Bacteroidales bacterium]
MRLKLLIPILLLTAGLAASAQCLPTRTDGVEPFKAGEVITMSISYNWHAVQTDVAKGTLSVNQENLNGERVWHTKMTAVTAPFFDVFFKIRERFESWFALKGMEPRKFIRDTYEGGYTATNLYVYDRKAGVIHANVKRGEDPEMNKDLPFGTCSYDLTTLLYFVRKIDMSRVEVGKPYKITFSIDENAGTLSLTYRGKENKYFKGIGTVATLKFGISVRSGNIFEGDQAFIWLTDDENHLPVAFMAPLKVGAMNGRLTSYKNLSNDFTALISTKRVK